MPDSCVTCRFAGPRIGYENHECRRNAPTVRRVEHWEDIRLHVPTWPIVKAHDWCGEWDAKRG